MHRMIDRIALAAIGLFLSLLPGVAGAVDNTWPRELDTEKGVLTIYQPQPEKFENNVLQARAALSLMPKGKTTPVFGVFWFTGRVDTDRDAGTSMLRDIAVTNSRWPESTKRKRRRSPRFSPRSCPRPAYRSRSSG